MKKICKNCKYFVDGKIERDRTNKKPVCWLKYIYSCTSVVVKPTDTCDEYYPGEFAKLRSRVKKLEKRKDMYEVVFRYELYGSVNIEAKDKEDADLKLHELMDDVELIEGVTVHEQIASIYEATKI